ncbi:MAG: AsmA family protein, partial [Alphaproteobacteria bacterium]|nr:AsmA family protein [Alphaproteobacteria bacterium]
MRKFLIGLAVLLSLGVIAVLVGPGLIDWTAYRSQIERQLTGLFGRAVTIDGAVDFAVLPTPILTAEGVRVAGPTAQADPMLEIGAIDARVAFAPLFSGTVRVESVTLDRPVVTVRRLPDGGTGWSGVLGREGGGGGAVRLDRVAINDGTIRLRAVDGRDRLVLRQIFGQVTAESLAGPFEALGSLAIGGQALTVDLRTGRLSAAGALPVTLQFGIDGADAEARYAGLIGLDGRLQGDVRTSGSDLAGLLGRLVPAEAVPAVLARPFSVDGRVDGSPAAIQLNAVTAELGAIRATGALSLVPGDGPRAVPQFDAALAVGRVDLDAFLDRDPAAPIDPAALGLALAAPEAGFALPGDLGISLDATAEAVIWRGGLVLRVRTFAAL